MKKLCVLGLCCAVLVACTSTGADLSSQSSSTTAAEPVESTTTRPRQLSAKETCETPRSTDPIFKDVDLWDDTGVITTSFDFDPGGNVLVTGWIGSEQDFDFTNKRQTVGSNETSFLFIAKFNKKSEFLWIRCFEEENLTHWFVGPHISTDSQGNAYLCSNSLEKFDPSGKLLWSSAIATYMTGGDTQDTALACATNAAGKTLVTGGGVCLIDETGSEIWSRPDESYSAAAFDSAGNIFMGSTTKIAKYSITGKEIWSRNFKERLVGPFHRYGYSVPTNTYPTEDVGLSIDSEGNPVFALPVNKKNQFSTSADSRVITPGWLQDVVVAKYTTSGALIWAHKIQLPQTTKKTTRYAEGFDISFLPNGDIIALGGGGLETNDEWQQDRLFLAKFTPDGEQTRFLWLGKYNDFIHNIGHRIMTNSRGRTYVTSEGEKIPPFLISRDM